MATTPSTSARTTQRAPRGQLNAVDRAWLAVVVGGGAWLSLMAIFPGLPGIPCIFRIVTGFSCPGCGMTRACRALLLGDVQGALAFHPLVFFVVGFVVVHTARVLTSWWRGRAWPGSFPRPVVVVLEAAFVAGFVFVVVDRARPIVTAVEAAWRARGL
jgi:hypothetical protein